jgi:Arc/MetJ family transcription regulator
MERVAFSLADLQSATAWRCSGLHTSRAHVDVTARYSLLPCLNGA